MNYQQQLNDWFADFEHSFDERVPDIVAETATEFFQERFKTEEWDNIPWPALSPKYAAKKTRGKGKVLTRTSNLRASIRPAEVTPNKVVISAGNAMVRYARTHNEGLRMRGIAQVKPYTNTNFMGKGKRQQIKGHSRKYDYKMPRRQFMGPSPYLNQSIIDRLTAFYNN